MGRRPRVDRTPAAKAPPFADAKDGAPGVYRACRLLREFLHSKAAPACSFHRWTFTPLTMSHSSSGSSPRAEAEAM